MTFGSVLTKNEQKNILGGDYGGGGGGGGGTQIITVSCYIYKNGQYSWGCIHNVIGCQSDEYRKTMCAGYFQINAVNVITSVCYC